MFVRSALCYCPAVASRHRSSRVAYPLRFLQRVGLSSSVNCGEAGGAEKLFDRISMRHPPGAGCHHAAVRQFEKCGVL